MFRREEQELAARLARVLDGREQADGELASLAAVLERAAEPARLDVSEQDVESALSGARGRLRTAPTRRLALPRIALAFGVAAAAVAAVLVVTLVRLPGVDVEGKALAALGGDQTVLRLDESIVPAVRGTFPASLRSVWLDPARQREQWTQYVDGTPVEATLVERGRVSRYLYERNTLIVGQSCRAFAGGCAEVVDPVAFYRDALLARGAIQTREVSGGGRKAYRLTLPVQTLSDAVRIEQVATIDAKTFLPREIEWREQRPGGSPRTVSKIVIEDIERTTREKAGDVFTLPIPSGARVIQRGTSRAPLRKLGERHLPLGEARKLAPPLLWVGSRFEGRRLLGIDEVRWNAGIAYRLRYRGVTVWNYSNVIPPVLAEGRVAAPSKALPSGRGILYFYGAENGMLVAELDTGERSFAVVAPTLYKEDVFRLVNSLKPLR